MKQRRLHKAFHHDPVNWPLLRDALTSMGRKDLIGNGKRHLVPAQPKGEGAGNQKLKSSRPLKQRATAGSGGGNQGKPVGNFHTNRRVLPRMLQ